MSALSEPPATSLPERVVAVPCPAPDPTLRAAPISSATAWRNIRMMHLLERVAHRFERANIPLMALKGAALQLTIPRRPDERPMSDLDLLIRPQDVDAALAELEEIGALRREPLFREDFFPRFYYELPVVIGTVHPVTIDLHVRPLRPLRLARLIPDEAFWERATPVPIGAATVLVPAAEEMLIHLAAHSAFHGNDEVRWLRDVHHWASARATVIDWDRFLDTTSRWRLTEAVRRCLDATESCFGPVLPDEVRQRLRALRGDWRDRIALWHAPRDQVHMTGSALVNVLVTPGWRFRAAYLAQVLMPDRAYMDAWRDRHPCRWRLGAVLLRWLRPLSRRWPLVGRRLAGVEIRRSSIHGYGVFATRDVDMGSAIAQYRGRPSRREGTYVAYHVDPHGRSCRHEITGPLRYLNHACRPNAELVDFEVVALVPIRAGTEITIDYGEGSCKCERDETSSREGTP